MENHVTLSKKVLDALTRERPVVALESTIISHGMPYPENLETAKCVEEIIEKQGAVPATIAILEGKVAVGLTESQLDFLAHSSSVVKASRRDLPVVLSKKMTAATTVAAAMICAHLAGIEVFVTGGIGGVHRGGETTFDISADLHELSKTDVAVVSSGAKAILDLRLTMEMLETLGIPVLGYRTDDFPAFYSRRSGLKVNYRVETPEEIARIIRAKRALGLKNGILITNPVPEEFELDSEIMDRAVHQALDEAQDQGIEGKEVTPFLLDRVNDITEGDSLKANIALIKSNACLGGEIALALTKIKRPS